MVNGAKNDLKPCCLEVYWGCWTCVTCCMHFSCDLLKRETYARLICSHAERLNYFSWWFHLKENVSQIGSRMNLYCQLVPCASRCHQMLLFCTPYVCYHFINIYNNILEKCPLKKIGIIHPVNKATSLSQKRISYEDSNFTSPLFLDHVINPKSRVVLSSTVATTHMWLMNIWNVSSMNWDVLSV